jgi:hypothetical protein
LGGVSGCRCPVGVWAAGQNTTIDVT